MTCHCNKKSPTYQLLALISTRRNRQQSQQFYSRPSTQGKHDENKVGATVQQEFEGTSQQQHRSSFDPLAAGYVFTRSNLVSESISFMFLTIVLVLALVRSHKFFMYLGRIILANGGCQKSDFSGTTFLLTKIKKEGRSGA